MWNRAHLAAGCPQEGGEHMTEAHMTMDIQADREHHRSYGRPPQLPECGQVEQTSAGKRGSGGKERPMSPIAVEPKIHGHG